MKEHPILFSTPMVQAILEGRKTQTRRVIKPQPKPVLSYFGWKTPEYTHVAFGNSSRIESMHRNPFGDPGDRLYVRETTIRNNNSNTFWPVADGYVKTADYEKTIPSIHMPKAAARIWLEVEEVKVEMLQNISDEDAKAEGVTPDLATDHPKGVYYTAFSDLWTKINGNGSWLSNPWVWVVKFKVLSTTGAANILARLNDKVGQAL